jgi:transcriptional regulator with XRE-family HTH domain
MTIREYRRGLGWSVSELARRAGLDYQTVSRAEKGGPVRYRTLEAIAAAFSAAYEKKISVRDLEGARVVEY